MFAADAVSGAKFVCAGDAGRPGVAAGGTGCAVGVAGADASTELVVNGSCCGLTVEVSAATAGAEAADTEAEGVEAEGAEAEPVAAEAAGADTVAGGAAAGAEAAAGADSSFTGATLSTLDRMSKRSGFAATSAVSP
jgi:hypothetical protein